MQSFLLDFGFCFISRLGPSGILDSLQTTAAWSAHGKRVFSHGQLGAMCVAAGSTQTVFDAVDAVAGGGSAAGGHTPPACAIYKSSSA